MTAPVLRCAVYTRKSSEDGLDQAFNSLHAQRDACEAFVLSQIGEGWSLLPEATTMAAGPAAIWSGPRSSACWTT